jgi:TolB-like protein/Tfp pilus assembly protein PilF/predicted Ser/Thr protein kinase
VTGEQWGQLKAIFRDAIEYGSTERAAYLDRACAKDPALRAEIESLLASHYEAETFIETPAFANNIRAITEAPAEPIAGRRIGSYQLVREIGHGGMGTVYLAERANEYKKLVAIKVIKRGMDTNDIVRRFHNERQILASLEHSNIAHLIDGGSTTDGLPYLVMEFVEGTPVNDYCDSRRLTTNERLQLFRTICAAVDHAHQKLVVHRDLKPSNILITAEGVPKLLDFGIAKVLNQELSLPAMDETGTNLRVLTPDYASPEQVRGEKLTTASDVYSLGIVLYELLTGHRPYRSVNTPPHELARIICEQEPTKPSTAVKNIEVVTHGDTLPLTITPESVSSARDTQPDKLRRRLSGDLDNIVLMALRKEPQRRYPTAAQLAADIGRHLDGLPVMARKDTFDYRFGKFVIRRKAAIAAALIVVLALVVGMAANNFYTRSSRRIDLVKANPLANVKTIAVLPLKSLSNPPQDQELRVGMMDSIVTKLSAVKQLAVRPTSSTIAYLDKNYDTLAVGRELKVDSILEGSVQKEANQLQINLQMVSVADSKVLWAESFTNDLSNVLNGQESVANRVSHLMALNLDSGSPQNSAGSSSNIPAQEAFLKGLYALTASTGSIESMARARDAFEHAIQLDPNFALAYSGLANTYTTAASLNLLSPRDSYPEAEKAAHRALELDPNMAPAYMALADVESDYNWNWQAAEADHKRALEAAPNYSGAHNDYAEFLARMGRFDEAAHHSELAHQLDPTKTGFEAIRALHYYYQRRFDDTIAQSKRVLEKNPSSYLAYLYLSLAEASKGNYSEGLAASKKAGDITGGSPPDLFVLGYNYALAKDAAKTDEILAKLQLLTRKQYVDPFYFAVLYANRGDKEKALFYLEQSYTEKSYWMTTLKVNPFADALRSDARFAEILQQMNLDK